MNLSNLGASIRKYRRKNKLSQEQLAEKVELSTNYIGMIERGEKIPALDTFLRIAKELDVSADMLLENVLYRNYSVKDSLLAEKLEKLTPEDREKIYDVIDALVKHSTGNKQ